MANNLTGDFEAVLQVSIQQINGILATIHQNKIDPAVSPSFMHSATMRIGASPLGLVGEAVRFKAWMVAAIGGQPQFMQTEPRQFLTMTAPLGLKEYYDDAWTKVDSSLFEPAPADAIRGTVEVQLANPTISMPPGFVSRVMVHVIIRARFIPDPGTGTLPAPIHGEVRAVYIIEPRTLSDGRRVVRVRASSELRDVQFIPMPGTISAIGAEVITDEVRNVLRTKFAPLDIPVDADFAFTEVAALGSGAQQALVLPLSLSGTTADGGIGSVANHFLGNQEFAIAVSRGYIDGFFNQFIETIKQKAKTTITSWLADYTVTVTSLGLAWKAGHLELSGHIDLKTDSILPNGWVKFVQNLVVQLDPGSQVVSLVAQGDPWVDESWWLPHSTAVNAVKTARDSGLPSAGAALNANATKARDKLNKALGAFDKSAYSRFVAVDTTPDGLIFRGKIFTNWRIAPIVHYAPTPAGDAFTAFRSWIPGGRIDTFGWSWVEQTHPIPWFNKTSSVADDHRFIFPKPAGLVNAPRLCLQIRGTRLNHDGWPEAVVAGEVCTVSAYEPILTAPIWWGRVMLPIWWPDPPDQVLDKWISAHVNVLADRPRDRPTFNTLIHFVGDQSERPLDALAEAFARVRRRDASFVVILVMPAGTFAARREEVERRLGSARERFPAALQITEDYAGGWTQIFAPREATSTHLIDANGAAVWSQQGAPRVDEIAHAIERHAVPSASPERVPLALSVSPGDHALEAAFTDHVGNVVALRRLSGRPVLLNFWQSWSSPCIAELKYLERLARGPDAPFVIAVNGGESIETVREMPQIHGLSLPLTLDPDQRIAARYGVKCWPTTVSINGDRIIDRVQFGMSPAARESGREVSSAKAD